MRSGSATGLKGRTERAMKLKGRQGQAAEEQLNGVRTIRR
jgi:hypothetical protein